MGSESRQYPLVSHTLAWRWFNAGTAGPAWNQRPDPRGSRQDCLDLQGVCGLLMSAAGKSCWQHQSQQHPVKMIQWATTPDPDQGSTTYDVHLCCQTLLRRPLLWTFLSWPTSLLHSCLAHCFTLILAYVITALICRLLLHSYLGLCHCCTFA